MACNFFVRSSTFRPAKCWYLWFDYSSPRQKMQTQKSTSRWEQPHPPQKRRKLHFQQTQWQANRQGSSQTPPFSNINHSSASKGLSSPEHQYPLVIFTFSLILRLWSTFLGTVKISLVIYFANTPHPHNTSYFWFQKKRKNLLFSFRDFVFVFCNLCSNYSCVDTICFLRWCNLCFLWIIPSLCLFVRFCRQLDLSLGHQTRNHIALFLGGLYVPLWAKLTSSFGNCWNFWTRRKGGRKRFW